MYNLDHIIRTPYKLRVQPLPLSLTDRTSSIENNMMLFLLAPKLMKAAYGMYFLSLFFHPSRSLLLSYNFCA